MLRRKLLGLLGLGGTAAAAAVMLPKVVEASKKPDFVPPPGLPIQPAVRAAPFAQVKLPLKAAFVSPYANLRVQISGKRAVQFRDNRYLTDDMEEVGALRLLIAQSEEIREEARGFNPKTGLLQRPARSVEFEEFPRAAVRPRTVIRPDQDTGHPLGFTPEPWSEERLAAAKVNPLAAQIEKRYGWPRG